MRGLLRCFHVENSIIFRCPKNNAAEPRARKSLCSNWTPGLLPMSGSIKHNETMKGALRIRLLEESNWGLCNLAADSLQRWRKWTSLLPFFLFDTNYSREDTAALGLFTVVSSADHHGVPRTGIASVSENSHKEICGCGDKSNSSRSIKNAKGWRQGTRT